jgi:ferritin-like protein
MAHEGFHEDSNLLSNFTKDYHRIIQSTIEEFEAVDWYNQRAEAATDPEAKAIMEHNRDEEIEHACMGLEWLRRNSPKWDAMMREFLFKEGSIIEQEAITTGKASADAAEVKPQAVNAPTGVLSIGNNK